MHSRHLFALLLALPLMGCGETSTTTSAPSPGASAAADPSAGTGHAPAAAVPGSHEDWCGEHQVPESQCTRCDSSLIAAFKATKDWCPEHGLPESQCLKCNPELKIERPPKGTQP